MKIVADENLAFTDYFFAEFGEIEHKAGRTLTHADVVDAKALLVRSVTQVNPALINNTTLQYVGSATIGTDHLDIEAIEKQNIQWANAAGCNAQAVAEYVITALLHLNPALLNAEESFTLGIIGLGNVGSRLAYMAKLLGWNVIGHDPFVQQDTIQQVDLNTLLSTADAISLHVPLTKTGSHPTYHLFNAEAFAAMKTTAILINSARGPVIEEQALLADIEKTQRKVVLDVFEHEPVISEQVLKAVTLVTPHIAGYSLEGKARGTQMIYEAFCKTFQFEAHKSFESQLPVCAQYFEGQDLKSALQKHLNEIYPIARDDQALRACLKEGMIDQKAFDHLRKTYPLRREWAAHGGPKA
ncbi:4-phosphoerythronate dehydrogenase [Acinetobacter johnsonii]|uniref:4-phosphoerythronate dehydrogenase n=1 Tax=Acinetobacter johnsonii TaxID=40214 RepID=UPI001A3A672B|nr:4-phosphoerythronate dehydrogenase [Acinetobacter johnsonii]MBL8285539.1 4-phosphoerythronate dehydrogenase [Acinetobacter johnsonii]MDV2488862.1 4-phosphoerythronate dehydrogenase [Acinetobacter johnsonii]